jgi:hypothetical protein
VIAYNPGLTAGTSVGGRNPLATRLMEVVIHSIFRLPSHVRPQYFVGTPERSGEVLAKVALGTVTPPPGRVHVFPVKGELIFPDPRTWHKASTPATGCARKRNHDRHPVRAAPR